VINKLKAFQPSTFQLSAEHFLMTAVSCNSARRCCQYSAAGSVVFTYYDRWCNPMNWVGKTWLSVYRTIFVGERVFRPVSLSQYLQKKSFVFPIFFYILPWDVSVDLFLHYRFLTICQTNSFVSPLLSARAGRQTAVSITAETVFPASPIAVSSVDCSTQM